MRNRGLTGDKSPTVVPKVPGKGDVRPTEVLAGVMDANVEGYRAILDKALICLVNITGLGQSHYKWNLIWKKML